MLTTILKYLMLSFQFTSFNKVVKYLWSLNQRFTALDDTIETLLIVTTRGGWSWHLVGETRHAANHPTGQPQHSIIWPQPSTVLRLRNPGLIHP